MFRAFVSVAPGLEPVLVEELAELGVVAAAVDGGAEADVDEATLVRVVRWSRVADHVTVLVGRGPAGTLDELGRTTRGLPWRSFVAPTQEVEVDVDARGTRMFGDPVARKVANAVKDALRSGPRGGPGGPRHPVAVRVRIDGDKAAWWIDAAGEPLHRRGWRLATAKAPLRENLAAAGLRVAGWRPGEALVDPMTGSGTLGIEAALRARALAPAGKRPIACTAWPGVPKAAIAAGDAVPRGIARDEAAPIVLADRVAGAVEAARANAARAGVGARVRVFQCAFAELDAPAPTGLVIVNPPWGERIDGQDARAVWGAFGDALRRGWAGWRVAVLCPDPRLVGVAGLPTRPVATFSSGGRRVGWYVGVVAEGPGPR